MTTDIARAEQEIAVERAALLANLAALEDRARSLTDWRRPIRQRPLEAVGVALAGGLMLGLLLGRRAPRTEPNESDDRIATRPSRIHPVVDRFVSAFAVVAAEQAMDALRGTLSGPKGDAATETPARVAGNGAP